MTALTMTELFDNDNDDNGNDDDGNDDNNDEDDDDDEDEEEGGLGDANVWQFADTKLWKHQQSECLVLLSLTRTKESLLPSVNVWQP